MRRILVVALCVSLINSGFLYGKDEPKRKTRGADEAVFAVVLREGQHPEWHHQGDVLAVTYGKETLLEITLGAPTEGAIPFTLAVSSKGRMFKWAKEMDDPAMLSSETTSTLFKANGDIALQFKTILWATFNIGKSETGRILLALPANDLDWWLMERNTERTATLTRVIDPQYNYFLRHGGRALRPGVSNTTNMLCALYVSMGDTYRQYYVSLPWPNLN